MHHGVLCLLCVSTSERGHAAKRCKGVGWYILYTLSICGTYYILRTYILRTFSCVQGLRAHVGAKTTHRITNTANWAYRESALEVMMTPPTAEAVQVRVGSAPDGALAAWKCTRRHFGCIEVHQTALWLPGNAPDGTLAAWKCIRRHLGCMEPH